MYEGMTLTWEISDADALPIDRYAEAAVVAARSHGRTGSPNSLNTTTTSFDGNNAPALAYNGSTQDLSVIFGAGPDIEQGNGCYYVTWSDTGNTTCACPSGTGMLVAGDRYCNGSTTSGAQSNQMQSQSPVESVPQASQQSTTSGSQVKEGYWIDAATGICMTKSWFTGEPMNALPKNCGIPGSTGYHAQSPAPAVTEAQQYIQPVAVTAESGRVFEAQVQSNTSSEGRKQGDCWMSGSDCLCISSGGVTSVFHKIYCEGSTSAQPQIIQNLPVEQSQNVVQPDGQYQQPASANNVVAQNQLNMNTTQGTQQMSKDEAAFWLIAALSIPTFVIMGGILYYRSQPPSTNIKSK